MIPNRKYVVRGRPWSSIIGYEPQLLLSDRRRCQCCLREFDPPFHYNEVREEWIERARYCDGCQPIVDAACRNMFDPAVLRRVMEESPKPWNTEYIDFDKSPTGRRLTPFVAPVRIKNVRLSYPHIKEPELRVEHIKIVEKTDYRAIEMRMLAAILDDAIGAICLDIEGAFELPGRYDLYDDIRKLLPVKEAGEEKPKRDLSYLKHDPTKKFRRPK
jgi:hypothetical protein